MAGALGLDGIWLPCCKPAACASALSRYSANFCVSAGSLLLAIAHSATISTTEPSLGWAYSTGIPFSWRVATDVGVNGAMAASPVCIISESLAELGMYSSTLGPMLVFQAANPGSTFLSLPPLMRLNIRKACRPKVDDGIDWNTTLPLNFGSARSIQEVGAAQPFSLNIFVL